MTQKTGVSRDRVGLCLRPTALKILSESCAIRLITTSSSKSWPAPYIPYTGVCENALLWKRRHIGTLASRAPNQRLDCREILRREIGRSVTSPRTWFGALEANIIVHCAFFSEGISFFRRHRYIRSPRTSATRTSRTWASSAAGGSRSSGRSRQTGWHSELVLYIVPIEPVLPLYFLNGFLKKIEPFWASIVWASFVSGRSRRTGWHLIRGSY